jgi:S-adenosylmethionine hydrolase
MGAIIITLTTDFGLTDAYVAAMKGVILGINPEAELVDICHTVRPQNVAQAAFIISTAYRYFPPGTIHLAAVDPGVGTARRAVILRTPDAYFVAPDNGVLNYVLKDYGYVEKGQEPMELPPELEAVAITRPEFWRTPVSATFHGRDIFAAVAARLSLGHAPEEFGEEVSSLAVLPLAHSNRAFKGVVVGHILHIDNFGNIITDITSRELPRQDITIEIGSHLISGLSRTYGEGEGLLALIGSSGHLEIALKEGSASAHLGADIGAQVTIRAGTK